MKYYKLRVDLSNISLEEVKKTVLKRAEPTYMYSVENEQGGNPHMHWYIEMPDDKASRSLRQDLRALGLKGNGGYSLKELDEKTPEEYMSYIMKDGSWIANMISDSLIQMFLDRNKKVQSEIKEKKAKRKTQLQQCMEAYEEAKKKHENKELYWHNNNTQSEIVRFVIEFCKKDDKLIREFQIVSICQTMLLKYDPCYPAQFHRRIMSKILD